MDGGSLEVLEWLREVNSSEENEYLLCRAMDGGNPHITEWAERIWSDDTMIEYA